MRTRPARSVARTAALSAACTPSPSPPTDGHPSPRGHTKTCRSKTDIRGKYSTLRIESTGAQQPTPTLLSGQKRRPPHPMGPRALQQHWEPTPMMTNEVGKLLTATEVAEMLHLHVNTVN